MGVAFAHFFSKKFQYICVSLDVNFNVSLTNDIVSFEQLGPEARITEKDFKMLSSEIFTQSSGNILVNLLRKLETFQ